MSQFDNAMRRQTYSLPELLRQQYADLEPKTRQILSFQEIFSIQRIVLTGCGDSHAAAMAAKYAFQELTGIPTEVVPAIELSRYYPAKQLGFAPCNPLVVAVSNSGSVTRVGEAVRRATEAGAFSLGVTGKPDSLLGQSASRVLKLDVPAFEGAPGVRSYLVCLLTLLLLAVRIAEVRGRITMDRAGAIRVGFLKQADALEAILPGMDGQALAAAQAWKDFDGFDFTAAGMDYAAAWYGHAKILEAAGRYAMCVNAEEWLHLNFFLRNVERTGTVVVCTGRNRGLSRVQELVHHAAKDMGRPTMVITDEPALFEADAARILAIPRADDVYAAALTAFVPCALLAGYISALAGETYSRGCTGPWAFAAHGRGVNQSRLMTD